MKQDLKLGIIFVTSGWFRTIGLQSDESGFSSEVEKMGEEIVTELRKFIQPIYSGIIYSTQDANKAAEEIIKAQVEGLIIAPLMWSEDQIVRAALKELHNLPIILCTFFPSKSLPDYLSYEEMLKGSGSVGTLQLSGYFKREGIKYHAVSGFYKDARLFDKLKIFCNALKVKQLLKTTKCGVLPFPCDQMSTTFVDEFNIRKFYGVEYKYLEISKLFSIAQNCDSNEIQEFMQMYFNLGYEMHVDERNLVEGIKYALAMEKLVLNEKIGILCLNDVIEEMHSVLGLRPSLYNPRLSTLGLVVSMEADIAAGIGMFIVKNFTNETPFYVEILNTDLSKNAFVLGHAGYHEAVNYDSTYPIKIVPDIEYKNSDKFTGAVSCFKYKSGDITLINCIYNGEKLKFSVIEGESLECPPLLEDTNHLVCKINKPVDWFLDTLVNSGISQHFFVIPGRHSLNLGYLCKFIDIEFISYI